MNTGTLQLVQELTTRDTKTLSQKALKVAEETGELARVILPMDNSDSTTHRFVTTEHALEEVVDVVLTSLSIAYHLGFSTDDVDAMMLKKCYKWDDLQRRGHHPSLKEKNPYEIHITVQIKEGEESNFRAVCQAIGVKPIIIDLSDNSGKHVMRDVMTSSVHMGTNYSAYVHMQTQQRLIESKGFKILRSKIETVPWHPAAPSFGHIDPQMPPDCYFEAHIPCVIDNGQLKCLGEVAQKYKAHLSKNPFKVLENGYVVMLTLRSYSGVYEEFQEHLSRLLVKLEYFDIEYGKVITEFSIFDSQISHDASWLTTNTAIP